MRIIIKSSELKRVFLDLLKCYSKYYWAVAWAGTGSVCYDYLAKHKSKIKKIVVGLHFYQTHPDFIREFMHDKGVRFIKQTDGTFHPKVYLFENDINDWSLLIGSGNFTRAAFLDNSEACMLITSDDQDSDKQIKRAKKFIDMCYSGSAAFNESELANYADMWQKRRPRGLGGKRTRHELKSKILSMKWPDYVRNVINEDQYFTDHTFKQRIDVLYGINEIFKKKQHFKDMEPRDRQRIAGLIRGKDDGINWMWFGRMDGNGKFHGYVRKGNINISRALDQIPLKGNITKDLYDAFVSHYRKAMPGDKCIATASRLLAMKRPDYFVCLDSANKSNLCNEFGIIASGLNYERYWDDIIKTITESGWWNTKIPDNAKERQVWENRSAFLDAIYYKPQ